MAESELGSKTLILYGESGVGKTLNATFFARLMYEWYGRPVCLISAEGSSRTHFDPLIKLGIVIPLWMNTALAMSATRRLRKGLWPHRQSNGQTVWQAIDWTLPKAPCAYVCEGLGSMSDLFMENMRSDGNLPPSKEEGKGAFDQDGEHFQIPSRGSYMTAQNEMLFTVRDFDNLPVKRVLWTAHEYKGQEQSGDPILGPGLAGRARTPDVQKYCATLLHFDSYSTTIQQTDPKTGQPMPVMRDIRRIWWMRHPDPRSGILYPAKVTLPGERLAALYEAFPGGYFEPGLTYGTGLDKFLRVEAGLVGGSLEATAKWKAELDAARTRTETTTKTEPAPQPATVTTNL